MNKRAVLALIAFLVILVGGSVGLWAFQQHRVGRFVVEKARLLDEKGQSDIALQHLSHYIESNPDDLAALKLRALILARSIPGLGEPIRDYEQFRWTIWALEKVSQRDPDGKDPQSEALRLKLAEFYIRQSDLIRSSPSYRTDPELALKQSGGFKYHNAIDMADKLIKDGPENNAGAHLIKALANEAMSSLNEAGALGRAKAEYHTVLRLNRGDVVASERLARLYVEREKQPEQANEIIEDLRTTRPDDVEARLARFRFFAGVLRDNAAATEELKLATELAARENAKAAEKLKAATKLAERKDAKAAEELPELRKVAFERAAREDSIRFLVAEHALRMGNTAEAHLQFEALSRAEREGRRGLGILAQIAFREDRPDEAIENWLKALMATGGTDAGLTFELASFLLRLDRVAEARPLIDQYRRLIGTSKEPTVLLLEALLDERTGRFPQAINELEKIEEVRKQLPDSLQERLYLSLGHCYSALGDDAKAMKSYGEAIKIAPKSAEPRKAIADLYASRGSLDDAVREIRKNQETADTPSLRVALATFLYQQQARLPAEKRSWAEVDAALEIARKAAPEDQSVIIHQAERLALDGKLGKAVELLEKEARRAPKKAALWVTWSEMLVLNGRGDAALKVLEEASQPDNIHAGDHAHLRIARARLLVSRGHGRQARDLLSHDIEALSLADRPLVWKALGELDTTQGDLAKARLDYAEWQRLLPDDPRPRVALLQLALGENDEAAIHAAVASITALGNRNGGKIDLAGSLARATELTMAVAREKTRSPDDKRLLEAETLINNLLKDSATQKLPGALLVRGKVREMQNRPDEAIEDYKEAWRHNMPKALPPLIALMYQRGQDLTELKKADPTAPVDRLAAEVALLANDRARAANFVRETAKSQSGQAGLELWQVNMLNLLGNRKEAEKELHDMAERHPEQLNPWLTLLQYQVATHQPKEAGDTVRKIMDRVATDKPELLQARCSWLMGDRAAADRAFQEVIRKYPNDVEGRMYAANFDIETGRPDQAMDNLKQVLKIDPNYRAAARKLAEMLLAKANDLASWEQVWETLGPDSREEAPEDRLLRANVLARHPDPSRRAEAIELLEGLCADLPVSLPFSSTVREALVKLLLQTGAFDRASRVAATSAAKNDLAAIALYVAALIQTKSWDEVERQLDRMHEIAPGDSREPRLRALLIVGRSGPEKAAEGLKNAVAALGQKPEAEALGREAFGLVIQAGPRDVKVAEWLGRRLAEHRPAASWMPAQALVLQGEYNKAFELCRIAAETDSRADALAASQVALGVVTSGHEDAESLRNAEAVIEAARAHEPSATNLLLLLSQVRRYQGRYEDEARIYREVLKREPDNLMVLNNLAWALAEGMNQPDEALKYIDQVISRTGKNADTFDTRGVILTRLGRFDEAIQVLEEVVRLRPSANFYAHLARAYLKAGQDEKFRKYRDAARQAGFVAKEADPSERAEIELLMKL